MRRPHVSINLAISADGKISSEKRLPSRWTSQADAQRLRDLRVGKDALIVGKGTLEVDQMTLTVPGQPVQPLRCVVSHTGKWNPAHPIFSKRGGPIHLLVTDPTAPCVGIAGAAIHYQTLGEFLQTLAEFYAVKTLHCEGGGNLIRALAELDAIDEVFLTLAGHTLFAGGKAPMLTGLSEQFLPKTIELDLIRCEILDAQNECFLHYSCRRNAPPEVPDQCVDSP